MTDRALLRRLSYLVLFVVLALIGWTASRAVAPSLGETRDFWYEVRLDGTGDAYGSLVELAKNSDLVVVGRIVAIDRSREWLAIPELEGDPTYNEVAYARLAKATIAVERVVGGGALPDPLEVEFSVLSWDQLPILQSRMPPGRSLFFLHQKLPPDDPGYYRLVAIDDAVVQDDGGRAAPVNADSRIGRETAGRDFESLVEDVVSLVTR